MDSSTTVCQHDVLGVSPTRLDVCSESTKGDASDTKVSWDKMDYSAILADQPSMVRFYNAQLTKRLSEARRQNYSHNIQSAIMDEIIKSSRTEIEMLNEQIIEAELKHEASEIDILNEQLSEARLKLEAFESELLDQKETAAQPTSARLVKLEEDLERLENEVGPGGAIDDKLLDFTIALNQQLEKLNVSVSNIEWNDVAMALVRLQMDLHRNVKQCLQISRALNKSREEVRRKIRVAMVHTTQVAAAAAVDASSGAGAARPGRGTTRSTSIGSFRAGSPLPTLQSSNGRTPPRRQSTHHRYHTFPTSPPKTPGRRPSSVFAPSDTSSRTPSSTLSGAGSYDDDDEDDARHSSTPLPWGQLALLALLSLAEQTALNSISPYLPEMVESFPGMDEEEVGLYVGLLASAFALAQLTTNLLWGYVSDIIGRKPVMLLGTSLLCICFAFFGFCTRYWHAVLVHVAMGLLNGNAAVVPTCLGELTDRSNQSKAFTWLPVVYSLGSITGPALGGVLVGRLAESRYPFLAPNILGASLLAFSVIVLAIWYEETLEERDNAWSEKFGWLCCCVRRAKKNLAPAWHNPFSNDRSVHESDRVEHSEQRGLLSPASGENVNDPKSPTNPKTWRQIFNRTTIMLLISYLFFQLSNISFSSLYPLFASGPEPTGRELHPDVIGISLSVAGIFTILFQLFLFRPLKAKLGNLGTYRGSLLGFAISMALMPFVGYVDSKPPFGIGSSESWLYFEMGAVLVIKNICAVGGLSSVMLLITNSAPSHASLGTVNGIAQTLSAAGRSVGPFVSGGLFTLSIHVQPKGEALAWGVFGGIALAGWVGSYAINGQGLESTDDGFEEEQPDVDHETSADSP